MCFKKDFKKLEKTKVQYITTTRTLQQLRKDLEKVSSQRENAAKDGLIRPFLYLVALSPVARLQIAINLGWTFIGDGLMGDSHAEAWDILSRKSLGLRDRMTRMRDMWFRREVNWYSILLPLCEELCVPAYMNWSEEFVSPKLSYSEALKEVHKSSSPNVDSLENELADKIGKHQRARMSSLQACSLAELKNSEAIRKLLTMPQLQSQAVQALLSYAMDTTYLLLARRDGSEGTGVVEAEDLLEDVLAFMCGVCSGEEQLFEELQKLKRPPKVGRDGVEVERDAPPPGSILNANITGFWLTMDLLDIDASAGAGKILPVVYQILLFKGRLALHGIRVEDYMRGDF